MRWLPIGKHGSAQSTGLVGKAIYYGTNPPPPPLPYKVLSREKAVSECLPVVSSTASVSMSLVFKRANEAKEGLQGPDCVTKSRELPSLSSEPQQVVLVGL